MEIAASALPAPEITVLCFCHLHPGHNTTERKTLLNPSASYGGDWGPSLPCQACAHGWTMTEGTVRSTVTHNFNSPPMGSAMVWDRLKIIKVKQRKIQTRKEGVCLNFRLGEERHLLKCFFNSSFVLFVCLFQYTENCSDICADHE